MVTTAIPHEIGDVSSRDEDRRFNARHVNPMTRGVVGTVHSSNVFWIDTLNLGRRGMSL
jgi:hypothetical protein